MNRERSQGGDERGAGSHNHDTEANVARESWEGNNTNDHANEGRQGKLDEVRRKSDVPLSTPDPCFGAGGSHERLLWDELRESLAKISESKGLLPSKCDSESAVEKATMSRADVEQRRRLIDDAIAVLLEDSGSDEEGVG